MSFSSCINYVCVWLSVQRKREWKHEEPGEKVDRWWVPDCYNGKTETILTEKKKRSYPRSAPGWEKHDRSSSTISCKLVNYCDDGCHSVINIPYSGKHLTSQFRQLWTTVLVLKSLSFTVWQSRSLCWFDQLQSCLLNAPYGGCTCRQVVKVHAI